MPNPGTTGAKRQSWDKHNPRDLLRLAIKNNPRGSEKEISDAVWETVRNERGYQEAIFEYWFANNYKAFHVDVEGNSVVVTEPMRDRAPPASRPFVNAVKEALRTRYLDHVLSCGKRIMDATFGDLAIEGGWLAEVAKLGKAHELVGRKLTEAQLLAIRQRVEARK